MPPVVEGTRPDGPPHQTVLTAIVAATLTVSTIVRELISATASDEQRVQSPPLAKPTVIQVRPRHVAIGGIAVGYRSLCRAGGVAQATAATASSVVRPFIRRSSHLPGLHLISRRIMASVEKLAQIGQVEEARARAFSAYVGSVDDRNAQHPSVVQEVVRRTVDEWVRLVSDVAVPVVLARLTDDPHAVQTLVREQSVGLGEDVTSSLRKQAARGDDSVERAARKVVPRRHRSNSRRGGTEQGEQPP